MLKYTMSFYLYLSFFINSLSFTFTFHCFHFTFTLQLILTSLTDLHIAPKPCSPSSFILLYHANSHYDSIS